MIIGIGIDAVVIDRFNTWHTYPQEKLLRIFSKQEISYCLSNKKKSAERFAARFAAREAFFKALSSVLPKQDLLFLSICKQVSVVKNNNGSPTLHVNWNNIITDDEHHKMSTLLSLTHTKTDALAFVTIQKTLPI